MEVVTAVPQLGASEVTVAVLTWTGARATPPSTTARAGSQKVLHLQRAQVTPPGVEGVEGAAGGDEGVGVSSQHYQIREGHQASSFN